MTLVDELCEQERAWQARPLLRSIYGRWFREVAVRLAAVAGPTVELGAGIARLKEVVPDVVATDVEQTPWAEAVVDAEALPYSDGSIANLVLVDVLHHLARPARFFDEARRVLRPGGHVVIVDPYCSFISGWAYRRFHHERTDVHAKALEDDADVARSPMRSNQARATLVFFRERGQFERRWPELRILERRRFAFLLYPLSGGFSRRQLVPGVVETPLAILERVLAPLAPVAAFRCLVVLERRR